MDLAIYQTADQPANYNPYMCVCVCVWNKTDHHKKANLSMKGF